MTRLVAVEFKNGIVYVDGKPVWAHPEMTGRDPKTLVDLAGLNERIQRAISSGTDLEIGEGEEGFPHPSGAPVHKTAILFGDLGDDTFIVFGGPYGGAVLGDLKNRLMNADQVAPTAG